MKKLTKSKEIKSCAAKEYFEFRIEEEAKLSDIKRDINRRKAKLRKELSKLNGLSRTRIDQAITIIKKHPYMSIEERASAAYDLIVSGMERSFKRHYEENKDAIIEYVGKLFSLSSELVDYRNKKKKRFNEFKKRLSLEGNNVSVFNLAYVEYQQIIKYIESNNITPDQYNKLIEDYEYLNDIISSFVLDEYTSIAEEKIKIKKQRSEEARMYEQAMASMLGAPKRSKEEEFVTSILRDMFRDKELI